MWNFEEQTYLLPDSNQIKITCLPAIITGNKWRTEKVVQKKSKNLKC